VNLPGGWELILVLLVVLLLFGSKRLPDGARALGRSLRIFKAETKGLRDDDRTVEGEKPRFDPYTGKPVDPPAGSESAR
jgi:sec-independent protein translocase protein TatA